MRYFLALLLPPVAVLLCGRPIQFIFNLLLCLCLWIPGIIHALAVVKDHKDNQRTNKIVNAIERGKNNEKGI